MIKSNHFFKSNILSYNPDEQAGPEVGWYWCGSAAKSMTHAMVTCGCVSSCLVGRRGRIGFGFGVSLFRKSISFWLGCVLRRLFLLQVFALEEGCRHQIGVQDVFLARNRFYIVFGIVQKLSLFGIGWIFLVILWI